MAFATFGAQAQEVTWRVPTSVPEGSPFYVNFLERFADNVGLLTDGAVEIQPLVQAFWCRRCRSMTASRTALSKQVTRLRAIWSIRIR
ncbi:TRAP transporter, DctP family protein [Nitratireductor aquibiodomus RA22]|uniref:TRAP transporter, DctP family protein n=1 Tax=Nitratireductor aquibiodomus RA22 TaxID=1189611 RepID=I5BZ28_9HYPH|nr:TRAP transporter, DctP family protein [Nitratireductor aquibiodomus RA22]